uniref:Uncharacterized protein n=1 Tax=Megaselia scalaris TaxID=36166 RepID=T1GBR4_MEGSC
MVWKIIIIHPSLHQITNYFGVCKFPPRITLNSVALAYCINSKMSGGNICSLTAEIEKRRDPECL